MKIQSNGNLASNVQDPQNSSKTPAENDPEKLKQTLKDGNNSAETNMQTLQKLRDSYSEKDKTGGATEAERDQLKLINNFLMGDLSNSNIQNLASSLGMSKEKLDEVANLVKGPGGDDNNLKGSNSI
ncbi:hypothetical protein [Noviherbaspirillum malthae]|uniref:hypothetical protein n=1 Tax=Noviherbaspirillum malthae TaxID=1260987 RepID=UPI00188E9D49|nr:hypothetical protein [Noviherbaspirillum malthae]